jgi:predicted NBD/HSP70 family sugar kinase
MRALGIDCGQLEHRFCLLDEAGKLLAEESFLESRRAW